MVGLICSSCVAGRNRILEGVRLIAPSPTPAHAFRLARNQIRLEHRLHRLVGEATVHRPTLAIGNYVDRADPDGPFEACDDNCHPADLALKWVIVAEVLAAWLLHPLDACCQGLSRTRHAAHLQRSSLLRE